MDKEALEAALDGYEKWLIVFGVLVAVGVVGEAWFGFLNYKRSSQLHQIQRTENLTLQKQVADAQAEVGRTNERLLEEQRRLAEARWRLERVERGVLPREIPPQQLQTILERLRQIPDIGRVNVLTVDVAEPLTPQVVQILRQAGRLGQVFITQGPVRGTSIYRANPAGEAMARVFWEVTGRFFGGWESVRAIGMETLPEHENAIVIGTNTTPPADGQPGEGIDEHGHPVARP